MTFCFGSWVFQRKILFFRFVFCWLTSAKKYWKITYSSKKYAKAPLRTLTNKRLRVYAFICSAHKKILSKQIVTLICSFCNLFPRVESGQDFSSLFSSPRGISWIEVPLSSPNPDHFLITQILSEWFAVIQVIVFSKTVIVICDCRYTKSRVSFVDFKFP